MQSTDLDLDSLRASLAGRLVGSRVLSFQMLDSTMDEARRLADEGSPEGTVVVVEPEPNRAKLAASLGATLVIDPSTEDFEARIREVCGPLGADVVFECAGIPTTID